MFPGPLQSANNQCHGWNREIFLRGGESVQVCTYGVDSFNIL